jgi:hypothetical protein
VLVAETPKLAELGTPNAGRTAEGLALATRTGRPFQEGNAAASNRGPSLTRVTADDGVVCVPDSPDERRRARRKAASLAGTRRRELQVQTGGPVSSAVRVELVAWASATAWADVWERAGDVFKATALREKASAFGLKALGYAEREAKARPRDSNTAVEAMRARILGQGKKGTP